MPTVIDALVVTLGLDPKKFGSGAQDATNKLNNFKKTVTALGVDETKLDAKQKLAYDSLRKIATQSQTTRKELAAAGSAGADFWGVLKSGALGFGAALGVYSLKAFVQQTVATTAATGRLAKNLGDSAADVTEWGRAVEQSVQGNAEAAVGSLQGFHKALLDLRGGLDPSLMQFFGLVARYSGKAINLRGPDNKWLPDKDIMFQLGDAAKAMGPEKAAWLMPQAGFDQDTTNFLELGSKGMQAALDVQRKIGGPSPEDVKHAQELASEETAFSQAVDQLTKNIVYDFAPALTGFVHSLNDLLSGYNADKKKVGYTPEEARARATGLVRYMPMEATKDELGDGDPNGPPGIVSYIERQWKGPDPAKQKARIDRVTDFLTHGMTAEQAYQQLKAEEAGAPKIDVNTIKPDLPATTAPGPGVYGSLDKTGGGMSELLDAIAWVESRGKPRAVSARGAVGRYQMMPATAAQYGVTNPMDPDQERIGAGLFLADMLESYGNRDLALAAYNWGPRKLNDDIAKHGDKWRAFLPSETKDYIAQINQLLSNSDFVHGAPRGPSAPARAASGDTTITATLTGPITITTQAKDAAGVATDLKRAVAARALTVQSNSGVR